MCAVHTLPYLSHKLFKIMFIYNMYSNSAVQIISTMLGVLIMMCYSSCQPFPSIYNSTICIRIIFTRFEARK